MKRMIAVAVLLGALGIAVGPGIAAVDRPKVPPKGIEGPDIRNNTQIAPLGVEGPEVR